MERETALAVAWKNDENKTNDQFVFLLFVSKLANNEANEIPNNVFLLLKYRKRPLSIENQVAIGQ